MFDHTSYVISRWWDQQMNKAYKSLNFIIKIYSMEGHISKRKLPFSNRICFWSGDATGPGKTYYFTRLVMLLGERWYQNERIVRETIEFEFKIIFEPNTLCFMGICEVCCVQSKASHNFSARRKHFSCQWCVMGWYREKIVPWDRLTGNILQKVNMKKILENFYIFSDFFATQTSSPLPYSLYYPSFLRTLYNGSIRLPYTVLDSVVKYTFSNLN